MSYTFGGGTGDDVTVVGNTTLGADNRVSLVAGWWYPTTLTATRGYWSAGNIFGAEVDTTTSEIRLRTDNTTDGQWVTSGAGIVTNKWHFLAFLSATENTTVAGDWRVWVGDVNTPPVMITPTVAVSRSGNYTGNATFYVGNKGTGTLAFQGDIAWVVVAVGGDGLANWPKLAASGVIATAEAERIERHLVFPLWQGKPNPQAYQVMGNLSNQLLHIPLDQQATPAFQRSGGAPANPVTPTYNGVTWTEHRCPVVLDRDWIQRAWT